MQIIFSPLVWLLFNIKEYSKLVFEEEEEEEEESIKGQVRSGPFLWWEDRSDYLSPPWLTSLVRTGVLPIYPEDQAVRAGEEREVFNKYWTLSGRMFSWRQFPASGRVWEKSGLFCQVQFSLAWHFILQNYSSLRLRQSLIHDWLYSEAELFMVSSQL